MSAWHITVKDLQLLLHDRRALVLLLILPLLFISIVGMSTGQFLTRNEKSDVFKIVVVDQNNSDTSHDLIKELKLHSEMLTSTADSMDAAFDAMRRGDASLIFIIGPQFESKVEDVRVSDIFNSKEGLVATGPSALDLSFDGKFSSGGIGKLLEAVLFSQVVKFVFPIAAQKNPITRAWSRSKDSNDEAQAVETPLPSVPGDSADQDIVYVWVVPGFTVMFAFFLISVMARSFIIERDQGTLRRLLMAPIGSLPVLLGKTIPYFLTSLVQCSLLFICGRILFGMSWGQQPLLLIPVILCTSAAATSLGLLLSTLVHTDQQVSSYGTTLVLLLSSISGCFFPRELFPTLMKQISLFTPHAWSLKAFDAILSQPHIDIGLVAESCVMLLVFTAAFFATGWWRFASEARE